MLRGVIDVRPSPSPLDRGVLERVASVDRAVAELAASVRLLHAVTPTNAVAERDRLKAAFTRGGEASPRWTYVPSPAPSDALRKAAHLAQTAPAPLRSVYLARIEEIALELGIQSAAGTAELAPLALRRYATATRGGTADATARRFVANPPEPSTDPKRATDARHPESLLGLLEAAIRARSLPFGVRVVDGLASLAATGAANVYVARGRLVPDVVARRTAVHEIEGHATPRARARALPLRLFFVGSAGGHDTQEGYALWHEQEAGLLDGARRTELGLRHLACAAMDRGADFVELVRLLVREHGAAIESALAIAERVFRGSDGRHGGLGRERVYLPHFLRVRAHLGAHPEDEAVLGSGQLGLDVLDLARAILDHVAR